MTRTNVLLFLCWPVIAPVLLLSALAVLLVCWPACLLVDLRRAP